ncbi:MAG: tetratricopeptide repeat protein [Chitinophagales bacterium]|nr:tetratricopeptide repeat protein [Chitinophagales bacterium]
MKKKRSGNIVKSEPISVDSPVKNGDLLLDKPWIITLIVFLLPLLLYINTTQNGFTFDDHFAVSKIGIKDIPRILSNPWIVDDGVDIDYRPLAQITYAVEYSLFGENPGLSHFFNAFLYAILVVLVFRQLKVWLKTESSVILWLSVAIFAAHPIHTEVVASLKNRDDLLSFVFSMVYLWHCGQYFENGKLKHILFGALGLTLSIFSKLTMIPTIAFVPLMGYFFHKANVKKYTALLGMSIVVVISFYIFRKMFIHLNDNGTYREIFFFENPLVDAKYASFKIVTGFKIFFWYIAKMIAPLNLGFYYGYNTIPVSQQLEVGVLLGLASVGALGYSAIYYFKRNPKLTFFICLLLISMFLYTNMIVLNAGIVSERAMLLASLPFSVLLVLFVRNIFDKWMPNTYHYVALLSIMIALFTIKTVIRNTQWKSNLTLMKHDIAYLDKSAFAHYMYGEELEKLCRQQYSDSCYTAVVQQYEQSLAILPENTNTLTKLGAFYTEMSNQPALGLPYLEKAAKISPDYPRNTFLLARCYQVMLRFNDAIANYEVTLKNQPSHDLAMYYLSQLYYESNQKEKAFGMVDKLKEAYPNSDLAYLNMGVFYRKEGNIDAAIQALELAVKNGNRQERLLKDIAQYYHDKGNTEKEQYYLSLL